MRYQRMNPQMTALLLIGASMFIQLQTVLPAWSAPSASAVRADGIVEVLSEDGKLWKRIGSGYLFRSKDQLRTGSGSIIEIAIADGDSSESGGAPIKLTVGGDSSIRFDAFGGEIQPPRTEVTLLQGSLQRTTPKAAQSIGLYIRIAGTTCASSVGDWLIEYDQTSYTANISNRRGLLLCRKPRVWLTGNEKVAVVDGRAGNPSELDDEIYKRTTARVVIHEGRRPAVPPKEGSAWEVKDFGIIRFTGQSEGTVAYYHGGQRSNKLFGTATENSVQGYWVRERSKQRCLSKKLNSYYWGPVELRLDPETNRISGGWGRCDGDIEFTSEGIPVPE